jgi:hypothetical protein
MQQLQSNLPEPLNQFPDCVSMKLHSSPQTASQTRESELQLTIRFGEQAISLPDKKGVVTFGLRRGELKLKISQGRIPLEKMGLTTPFQTKISIEKQRQEGRAREANITKDSGLKFSDSSSTTDKIQDTLSQVRSRGTETNPVWVFEEQIQDCLSGSLVQERLGTVTIEGNDCVVMATFEVTHQVDICFIEMDELLPQGVFKTLSRHKQRLIYREFFTRSILPQLLQPLSQVEHRLL